MRRIWFGPRGALDAIAGLLLAPLGAVVGAVAAGRRRQIAQDKAQPRPAGQPKVVVVGNLVVGGTGKTPLLIALSAALAARGWRPGVIARGYRGRAEGEAPRRIGPTAVAAEVGDEPLLVAQRTGRPVVIGRDRGAALRTLLEGDDCDVVLSDDGLQHVGLRRDIELAVFDARGAGTGRCLPAGPLREPLRGALLLDAVLLNGRSAPPPIVHSRVFRFEVVPTAFVALDGSERWTPAGFAAAADGMLLDAIAGIGAPQRFFDTLDSLGLQARQHPLPDHAPIDPGWLAALPGTFLVMTEKDAVKCAAFDPALLARCVALRVEAVPEPALVDWLEDRLRG
ncbi:MAG: tetraacyldisaccharide 4'-kinase [Burkholderiales bacterium]|nr:tetraacyldisaccharide 4'-kinase [Burkholderiales bacterium]